MALIPAKCTQCGANITVDNTKEAGICESCGTPFITEKVINNYTITNNIHADVINIVAQKEEFEIVGGTLIKYKGSSTDVVIPSTVMVLAQGALENCKALRSIYLPSSVTKIEQSCFPKDLSQDLVIKVDSLQMWVNLENNDAINFGKIGIILEVNGQRLETAVLPEGLEYLRDNAFRACKTIKKVVLPNSLVSIGKGAFCICKELAEVEFPSSLKEIKESAFSTCKKLRKIYLPDSVTTVGKSCFIGCESLTDVRLSNNMRIINESTFNQCNQLLKIDIPTSIIQIDIFAFADCPSLFEVNIGNSDCKINPMAFFGSTPYEPGKKKGCYVATCVYGSYDCPEVWTLRRFRDDTLASTWYGRAFIHTYYAISPTLVKWFGETTWFKKMWQGKLDKMVESLCSQGVEDTPYQDKEW